MKAFGLMQNLGERAHIRNLIAKLDPSLPGSPASAAETLLRDGPFDILILDERFEDEIEIGSRRNQLTLLDALQLHRERFPDHLPWVLVILNETVTPDRVLQLSKAGADFFLLRPFGLKEIGEKLAATLKCLASPPPLLAKYHEKRESFLNAAKTGDVTLLRELQSFSEGDLPVTMLLVQVLLQKPESMGEAVALLEELVQRYPESLSVRAALVAALCREKKIVKAFEHTQVLCRIEPSDKHFALALSLARKTGERAHLERWAERLLEYSGDPARKARLDALNELVRRANDVPGVSTLLSYLERNHDLRESVAEGIIKLARDWIERSPAGSQNPSEVSLKLLDAAVNCDPGTPLIEAWVDMKLAQKDYKTPYDLLERARRLKRFREEHYASAIRLALAEKNLKEASDQLQQARRFAPTDERWDFLAKTWKEMYAASSASHA